GMIKRCGQSRLAVAAGDDFGVWPDLETDFSEHATILGGSANRQGNSRAIDFLRQLSKEGSQTLGGSEPKIRWRQFSLIEDAKFGAGCARYGLDHYPGGFRSAAFNPENALTGFHDWLCLAAFVANGKPGRDARAVASGRRSAPTLPLPKFRLLVS